MGDNAALERCARPALSIRAGTRASRTTHKGLLPASRGLSAAINVVWLSDKYLADDFSDPPCLEAASCCTTLEGSMQLRESFETNALSPCSQLPVRIATPPPSLLCFLVQKLMIRLNELYHQREKGPHAYVFSSSWYNHSYTPSQHPLRSPLTR